MGGGWASDAGVGGGEDCGGGGLGAGLVGGWGGGRAGVRRVGAVVVVAVGERVELGLELGEIRGGGLLGEPLLHGGVEAFDFPAGGRVVGWLGLEFFWTMRRLRSSFSNPLRPPLPPPAKRVV